MVDSISNSALSGNIKTLLHRKKHQWLNKCEIFPTYNNNRRPLASLGHQHSENLFPDNQDHKEAAPTSKMEIDCISELYKKNEIKRYVSVNSFW